MTDTFTLPSGPAAVATLIATEGTSPKEAGAKMWVDASGAIVGETSRAAPAARSGPCRSRKIDRTRVARYETPRVAAARSASAR
ncbi:MAG: XdhC family protein [Gemmatimonadota bacterium]